MVKRRAVEAGRGVCVLLACRVRSHELMWDLYYGAKLMLLPASHTSGGHAYYARERWPQWDFRATPPQTVTYQKATYTPLTMRHGATVGAAH